MHFTLRFHVLFCAGLLLFVLARGAHSAQEPIDVMTRNRATSWVNEPKEVQMPTGVTHRTFFSKAMNQPVGYCIYLPPGYDSETAKRYPVIYNLHGANGTELHGFADARALHDGIVSGRWPPMILVLPNGGRQTFYMDSADGKFPAETLIVRELIPYIDTTYRTIAARKGRAIEGFSMGGRGANTLAMKFPELFCSLHVESGNVVHLADLFDPAQPDKYPANYLGNDRARYVDNDAFLLLKKNVTSIKSGLRIAMTCGTSDPSHLPSVREFHEALVAAGVDHTYHEEEGIAHDHVRFVNLYHTIWYDYHVESFRLAAARP